MTHESSFLQAIVEAPDDDAVRLVYSDWLEENGRPARAEFVRVQVELAGLGKRDPRRAELRAREQALLRKHERAWLGPLRAWLSKWEFRRGLIEAVTLKAQVLLKQCERVFRLAPIRHAEIHHAEKLGRALADCPQLGRLTSLRVRGFRSADSAHLIASPHLGGLTSLDLREASLMDSGVQALAASPLLAHLSELDLTCNSFHDEGAQALARSPHVSHLERLGLSRNDIRDAGAFALATSKALPRLRWLSLCRSWIGQEGKQMLRARFGEGVEFT